MWARDPLGHRTDFVNDAAGLPTGIMRHDGLIEKRDYDAQHRLVRLVDFRGGVTRFERDAFGRVVAMIDPAGRVNRFAYEERPGADFWSATVQIRPDGVTLRRIEDLAQATLTMVDGEGRKTVYAYGLYDLLEQIEDAKGGRLRFAYDHEERLVQVENQLGLLWRFERDAAGRVVKETDFSGLVTEYGHDQAGRAIEARFADGARSSHVYDEAGLPVRDEVWEPDAANPVVTTYWRDADGVLAGAENADARVTFARDALGRIVSETLNGRMVDSTYDCCGNRLTRRVGGRLVACAYDPLGATAEIRIGDHSPLRFERDALGRETSRGSADGFRLDQSWDSVGRLRSQRAGRAARDRTPDRIGGGFAATEELARLYDWTREFAPRALNDARWGETSYVEDDNGQISETRRGDSASERFSYDPALNLEASAGETGGVRMWRTEPAGRAIEAFGPHGERIALEYDARRRVVARRIERAGFRPKQWRYRWDARDRLVSCETPSGETWTYAYDPFGRRVSKTRRLSVAERTWARSRFPALVVASADEREAWAVAASAPPPGASALDTEPPVVGAAYMWDGDTVIEEAPLRLDGTVDWGAATRWHYEADLFAPVAREAPDGSLAYVVTDHLGTPRELFDADGSLIWAAEHQTWGALRRLWIADTANDNGRTPPGGRTLVAGALALKDEPLELAARRVCPIRFQGQWEDEETGLYYNRFRHYDPLIGQYASPDPIGLGGGYRPQAYVTAPHLLIDPLGLAPTAYKMVGTRLCIVDKFPTGSPQSRELGDFTNRWNTEIKNNGGSMTTRKLTAAEQRASDKWKREQRRNNPQCCANGEVAGHVPDAGAGGPTTPTSAMWQDAGVNSYVGGIVRGLGPGVSYTGVSTVRSLANC